MHHTFGGVLAVAEFVRPSTADHAEQRQHQEQDEDDDEQDGGDQPRVLGDQVPGT